jgi:hypothetical protein
MISAIIGSSNAERDGHFPLVSELAYQEGADFTANLFRRHLRNPIAPDAFIYIAYGTKQRFSDVAANSCAP